MGTVGGRPATPDGSDASFARLCRALRRHTRRPDARSRARRQPADHLLLVAATHGSTLRRRRGDAAKGVARMSDNLMSRRKFLVSAGTVAAAAGLAGVGLAKVAAPAGAVRPCRLGRIRPTPLSSPIPETLARRAYELYYYVQGGCAEATWWPIIESLAWIRQCDHVGHAAPEDLRLWRRRRRRLGHLVRHLQRLARHHRHGRRQRRPPQQDHRRDHAVLRRDAAADQRHRQGDASDWAGPAARRAGSRCRTSPPPPPTPSSVTPRCRSGR